MSRSLQKIFFRGSELSSLFRLAIPVFIAQTAQTGMTFVDIVMTGQFRYEHMAAVGIATSIWVPLSLLGLGILLPLSPLIAQAVGAKKASLPAHYLRQGILLSIAIALLFSCLFYNISQHFSLFGLSPELAALSGGYLRMIMWGYPGFLLFACARSLAEGHSRTRPAMVIALVSLALNIPCNYVLIYGKLGFPALGAVGCGIASAICYWFMAILMILHICYAKRYASLRPIFAPLWQKDETKPRLDRAVITRICRLGMPNAFALFFESSLFALTSLLLAPMGTIVVAGHQAAQNYSSMVFMVPLSLGISIAIRVAHSLGAGKIKQAHIAAYTALITGLFCVSIVSLVTVLFRTQITTIYSSEPEVLALASTLLIFTATYQCVDTLQTVLVGILRGYNDTRIISIVCILTYWGVGLPLGYGLCYGTPLTPSMGPQGFWISYIVALTIGSICYGLRLRHLHKMDSTNVLQKING